VNVVLPPATTAAVSAAGISAVPTTTSTTIDPSGAVTGVTIVSGPTASATVDTTSGGVLVVAPAATVNTNDLVLGGTGGVVATGGTVTAGTTTVAAGSTGVISVQTDPTTGASSSVNLNTLDVPAGSTLAFIGSGGTATIGTSAGSGGVITCDGTTVCGTVNTNICVAPPPNSVGTPTNRCTLGCKNTVVKGGVCGTGTTVTVDPKADVTLSGTTTVDPDVVVSGNLNVGASSLNGATSVAATGSITLTTGATTATYIKNFSECLSGGVIHIQSTETCDYLNKNGVSGTAFQSASVTTSAFACTVDIVGAGGCTIVLKVVIAPNGGPARRLLSTTSGSNCGTATVGNNGMGYNVCSQPSAAFHSSVSYIALCLALFIALFFQF